MAAPQESTNTVRGLAALLSCFAGLALIAGLWLRDLSGLVVIDAVGGAIYLLLALGLLGNSRFALFMGIAIPTAVAVALWWWPLPEVPFREQQIIGNGLVATLSAIALWQVRNTPTA